MDGWKGLPSEVASTYFSLMLLQSLRNFAYRHSGVDSSTIASCCYLTTLFRFMHLLYAYRQNPRGHGSHLELIEGDKSSNIFPFLCLSPHVTYFIPFPTSIILTGLWNSRGREVDYRDREWERIWKNMLRWWAGYLWIITTTSSTMTELLSLLSTSRPPCWPLRARRLSGLMTYLRSLISCRLINAGMWSVPLIHSPRPAPAALWSLSAAASSCRERSTIWGLARSFVHLSLNT